MQVPPALPLRIPLRRPPRPPSRRPATVAFGIAAGVHVLMVIAGVAAIHHAGDADAMRQPRRAPAEHAAYVEVGGWPDAETASQPGASPARGADAGGGASGAASAPTPSAADTGRIADPASPTAPSDATVSEQAGAASIGGAPAAAGRARFGAELGDARLVVPQPPESSGAPSGAERYLTQFRAALQAFNDSIQDLADRERRAANWTWTDPEGRAWGVRQRVLYIAGQGTIYMEMHGERDQELLARQQARARREGQVQAERLERGRYLQERDRAVRTQRDRERASAP